MNQLPTITKNLLIIKRQQKMLQIDLVIYLKHKLVTL